MLESSREYGSEWASVVLMASRMRFRRRFGGVDVDHQGRTTPKVVSQSRSVVMV